MLELLTVFKVLSQAEGFNTDSKSVTTVPISWILIALIISFGSAYIAYACNEYEKPATRALSTIIGFFFSGFYLIYYFIIHVMFDRKCSSRGINNIIRNISKK